jgi:hypothetical protein
MVLQTVGQPTVVQVVYFLVKIIKAVTDGAPSLLILQAHAIESCPSDGIERSC